MPFALWERASLSGRLMMAISLALLLGGMGLIALFGSQEARQAHGELHQSLDVELKLLPGALTEIIIAGDFASAEQYLDYLVLKPNLTTAHYIDRSGAQILAQSKPLPKTAPDWFARWLGLDVFHGKVDIKAGD